MAEIKLEQIKEIKEARDEIKRYKHGNGNTYTCGLNKAVEKLDKLIAEIEETRWVTFFYNSMKKEVSDLKVHSDRKSALRYFNENGSKYFKQFTPVTSNTLPTSCGSVIHSYYITSIEEFEEAFNYSTDEVLKLAGSEE